MRDWLSRKQWNAEKRYWKAYEAEQHAKAGRSLVTEEECATLSPERLRQLGWNRFMSLKHTYRAQELGWTVVGDVASRLHKTIDQNGNPV